MTGHQEAASAAQGAAHSVVVGYAGATIAGMSIPDWAAVLAILCSICLLIQYAYKFWGWASVRVRAWRRR